MPEITKLAIFPLITDTGVNLNRNKSTNKETEHLKQFMQLNFLKEKNEGNVLKKCYLETTAYHLESVKQSAFFLTPPPTIYICAYCTGVALKTCLLH